jgi:hypothetical protein
MRKIKVSRQVCWAVAGLALIASSSCTRASDSTEQTFTARDGGTVARVSIPDSEPRSLGTYRAEVTWPDGTQATMQTARDGMIDTVWLADLDGDGTPELVVATSVVGSGAYGDVQVYHRTGGTLTGLAMPPVGDDGAPGYMGHDVFSVRDGRLFRTYPVYREGDANAEPTGGEAVFWYSLADSTWVRQPDSATTPP